MGNDIGDCFKEPWIHTREYMPIYYIYKYICTMTFLLRTLVYDRGKNFVIKYEGSFKNGNSDCLVLEHVEHDRPEVNSLLLLSYLV